MCPAMIFSFVVGRLCYLEDPESTKQFLLSLPLSKRELIMEKNILSYLSIIVGMVISNGMGYLCTQITKEPWQIDIRLVLVVGLAVILFNTVYIGLNYLLDYSKTQYTSYILMFVMFAFFKFGNEIAQFIGGSSIGILLGIVMIGLAINFFALRQVAKCMK